MVLRYNSNGSLDNTFGTNGKAITKFNAVPSIETVTSVGIQSDGKILAFGSTYNDGTILAFARYNTDGSLDNSFAGAGKDTIVIQGLTEPKVLKIQDDGKILLLAYVSGFDLMVIRLNSDGSLDNTFGIGGKVIVDPTANDDYPYDMVIQNDGKIVICGTASGAYDIFIIRLNTDGTLDTTFDTDGILTTDHENGNQDAFAIALQSDGKIVIGGRHFGFSEFFIVARYNTDGGLDVTFDSDGILTGSFGGDS